MLYHVVVVIKARLFLNDVNNCDVMNYHSPSAFPTVATVIGFTPEAGSGPLVATLACPVMPEVAPTESVSNPIIKNNTPHVDSNDPITKAVVDNIVGNLPTKKQMEKLSCEVCNIEVIGQHVLENHLAGSKHAKKLKTLELMKEMLPAMDKADGELEGEVHAPNCIEQRRVQSFICQTCSVVTNSLQQLHVHCTGTKHKNRIGGDSFVLPNNSENGDYSKESISAGGDPATRFFCPTCNLYVNSDTQLRQHKMSQKHTGRLLGSTSVHDNVSTRVVPYQKNKRPGQGGGNGTKFFKCNVCNIYVNSETQLQQHNYSRKHNDKLAGHPEQIDTSNTLPPQKYIKKSWLNSHFDSYSGIEKKNQSYTQNFAYNPPPPPTNTSGFNYHYPKWTPPSFQRSQPSGFHAGVGSSGFGRY